MALGIALVTNSNLGTTPITSLPYALGAIFALSLGTATFLLNLLFVALQKVLLRKEFSPAHLLQLPAVLLFSVFIDICMWLTRPLITAVYPLQILLCLIGCGVLGLGISLEIVSNATVQPGEGIVIAIAYRARKIFGNIKVLFDLSLVALAGRSVLCRTAQCGGAARGHGDRRRADRLLRALLFPLDPASDAFFPLQETDPALVSRQAAHVASPQGVARRHRRRKHSKNRVFSLCDLHAEPTGEA